MSTWIKLHDNFCGNPKILAAGEDAAWVYVSGLLYCSRHLTDGRIPTAALRVITARKDAKTLARILVREGLWTETPTGWLVHDYLDHQRSREQVEREREANRQRVARHRQAKARNGAGNAVSNGHVTEPETDTETDNPTPTPPPLASVTTASHVTHSPDPYRSIAPEQVDNVRALRAQFGGTA